MTTLYARVGIISTFTFVSKKYFNFFFNCEKIELQKIY